MRTSEQITAWFAERQHTLDRPQQYLGDEPNSWRKPWDDADVRVCMFACWAYDQAAGNVAIPTVYKAINAHHERYLCDRSYFPATPRDLRAMESAGIPTFGIESRRPLGDFDLIGTSVSYPVLTINLVKQLQMSGIPVLASERQADPGRWPMVLVGGQSYGAPEVLANVVDAWWCGEAEDEEGNPGIGVLCDRIALFKAAGRWEADRLGCYADLAREFRHLYVPRFYGIHYGYSDRPTVQDALYDGTTAQPSKQVIGWTADLEGMHAPAVKRFVSDLDAVEILDDPPLLYADPGTGVAADLEVARGCPAWCSFCALTYRQKPYRQRSVETSIAQAKRLVDTTGSMHVSPFSPDFPQHTEKKRLVAGLLEQVTDEVNASSMRVDDFTEDPRYALLQAHAGMDAVSLGVEGNSQRMRDLVGKGCSDADIEQAVLQAIQSGIGKVKLYMIASLPGEDETDIRRILELGRRLADLRDSLGAKTRIQMSWTPLLIEANTPMQWFAPTHPNHTLGEVWDSFADLKIEFKMGAKAARDRFAFFQASQRASREAGLAMIEAAMDIGQGCWGGAPKGMKEKIEERLRDHGFHNGLADLFDERFKTDMFGWEHIDQGVNVEMMWLAYAQMVEFLEATDSRTYDANFDADYHGNEWIQRCDQRCYGKSCGVCAPADLKIRAGYIGAAKREIDGALHEVAIIDQRSVAAKVRLKVVLPESHRTVGHDHWRYALRRAAFLAGVPIAKRTVRFAGEVVNDYRDLTHGVNYAEFGLVERPKPSQFAAWMEAISAILSADSGVAVLEHLLMPASIPAVHRTPMAMLYRLASPRDHEDTARAVARLTGAEPVPMTLRVMDWMKGVQRIETDAREHVSDAWVHAEGHREDIHLLLTGQASPYDVLAAAWDLRTTVGLSATPAERLEVIALTDAQSYDAFRPVCDCGRMVDVTPLGVSADDSRCLRCTTLEPARVG